QVYLNLRGREYTGFRFRTPGLYRYMRHPIYFSRLCIFWATPRMTAAHPVFSLATTGYILVAIGFEERDLIRAYGDAYRVYRERVPRIVPLRFRWKPESATNPAVECPEADLSVTG